MLCHGYVRNPAEAGAVWKNITEKLVMECPLTREKAFKEGGGSG